MNQLVGNALGGADMGDASTRKDEDVAKLLRARDGERQPSPTHTREELVEVMARAIAARKCGVKDKTGRTLPKDIWGQATPDASAALSALEAIGAVNIKGGV